MATNGLLKATDVHKVPLHTAAHLYPSRRFKDAAAAVAAAAVAAAAANRLKRTSMTRTVLHWPTKGRQGNARRWRLEQEQEEVTEK